MCTDSKTPEPLLTDEPESQPPDAAASTEPDPPASASAPTESPPADANTPADANVPADATPSAADRLAQRAQRHALWGAALRTIGASALIAFSVVLYLQQLRGRWVDKFIESNELDAEARNTLILSLIIGALIGALVPSGILLWKRSARAVSLTNTAVRIAAPLVLAGAGPAIFRWKPWLKDQIGLSLAIVAFVLVLERTTRISLEAVPDRAWAWMRAKGGRVTARAPRVVRYAPFVVVVAGAIFYAVFMSTMALRLHYRLETRAFDLGGYDSLFYNAYAGHPFRCPANVMPTGDWSSLKGHAELSIYALLPLYALYPRAETLLVLQSSLLGLGAIPVYLLAARRIHRLAAALVAFCYLAFPAMHSANLFDVHMQPMAVFFVLWVAYFVEAKRHVLLAFTLLIALGCREDISIGLTVGALFCVFTGYRPVAGMIIASISMLYFGVMRFYIMPMVGEWWFQGIYKDLFPPGEETFLGVAKTLITNPVYVFGTLLTEEKLVHLLYIFTPVALVPLRRSYLWVLLLPGALFTVLTTGYKPTVSPFFQYVGHWIPYLFIATGLALAAIGKEQGKIRQASVIVAMVVATLSASYNWGAFFQNHNVSAGWGRVNLKPLTDKEREKLAQLEELVSVIPKDASVGASETELPHLSNRVTSYTLRYWYDKPDYILYRNGTGKFGANQADKELKAGRYERVDSRGPFILLKKK